MTIEAPLARLVAPLDHHDRLAIALSGGADSMTLAHVATRHSATRVTKYHAAGPAVSGAARERVEAHAVRRGWALVVVDARELADARYRANPVDRCHYCKTNLYERYPVSTRYRAMCRMASFGLPSFSHSSARL